MFNKDVIGFLKCIEDDPAVLTGLGDKPTLEEIVKVARDKGFTITAADLDMAMKVTEAIIKKADGKQIGELSEEDLAQVAGGNLQELVAQTAQKAFLDNPNSAKDFIMPYTLKGPNQDALMNLIQRFMENHNRIVNNLR